MGEWRLVREDFTREIYENENFEDEVLIHKNDYMLDRSRLVKIPGKGAILTKMNYLWAMLIEDMINIKDFDTSEITYTCITAQTGRCELLSEKLIEVPIECVVRGHLTGSAYEDYLKTGKIFGHEMPQGLVEGSKLPEPIFTPRIKTDSGYKQLSFREYDELLSDICENAPDRYNTAMEICNNSITLYKTAYSYAYERGIVIADTCFEYGFWGNKDAAHIRLAGDILNPDSSRFWNLASLEEARKPVDFIRQPLHDYLRENPEYNDTLMPQEVVVQTLDRYKTLYDILFGDFTP